MSIKKIREYTINVDGEAGEVYQRDCEKLLMQYQSFVNMFCASSYRAHLSAAMDLANKGDAVNSKNLLDAIEPGKIKKMAYEYADEIYKEQIAELVSAMKLDSKTVNEIN